MMQTVIYYVMVVLGCFSSNYDADATEDDGSCEVINELTNCDGDGIADVVL